MVRGSGQAGTPASAPGLDDARSGAVVTPVFGETVREARLLGAAHEHTSGAPYAGLGTGSTQ